MTRLMPLLDALGVAMIVLAALSLASYARTRRADRKDGRSREQRRALGAWWL